MAPLVLRTFALLGATAVAHVCLLHPAQRGGFNVADPGDRSCFQPTGPCGSAATALPAVSLVGGQGYNVVLQQNLNHYNPGHAGFLDVGIAPFFPATSDDNFTVLATIPDYWSHWQGSQTNFSIPVVIPSTPCDHCVLRIRYNPNKPTEPVFHNCADVSITAGPAPTGDRRVLALLTPGAPASAASQSSTVAEILPSGAIQPLFSLAGDGIVLVDGMSTAVGRVWYGLGVPSVPAGSSNAPAWTLVSHDTSTGVTRYANISLPAGDADAPAQWAALVAIPSWAGVAGKSALALLGLSPVAGNPNAWVYQARVVDPVTAVASRVLALSPPQDTFVNVFGASSAQADAAGTAGTFFFLAGDENSLFELGARVVRVAFDTAAPAPSTMTLAVQDVSKWTLGHLHLNPAGGAAALLSVSPGLYGNTSWHLVAVDASSGGVTEVGRLAPDTSMLASWYGGTVGGEAFTAAGGLLHLFRQTDGSLALATLDVASGAILTAPTLLTGVNGALAVTGLVAVTAA